MIMPIFSQPEECHLLFELIDDPVLRDARLLELATLLVVVAFPAFRRHDFHGRVWRAGDEATFHQMKSVLLDKPYVRLRAICAIEAKCDSQPENLADLSLLKKPSEKAKKPTEQPMRLGIVGRCHVDNSVNQVGLLAVLDQEAEVVEAMQLWFGNRTHDKLLVPAVRFYPFAGGDVSSFPAGCGLHHQCNSRGGNPFPGDGDALCHRMSFPPLFEAPS